MEENLITLAIHTYRQALTVKRILESHGIEVKLEKFTASGTNVVAAIRVKIKETDLSLALKITESMDHINIGIDNLLDSSSGKILIPVDLKSYSIRACRMGFELARRLSLQPVVLHSYATPYFKGNLADEDISMTGVDTSVADEAIEMEVEMDLKSQTQLQMRQFKKEIEKEQESGNLPKIKFVTVVNEGLPEDVIKEYCRLTPPELVVMATRGKKKKDEEMIGSVTAEILDSCRVPILSIPEEGSLIEIEKIKKLVFFCGLDQHDILTVDSLMRMFNYPEADITLIPVNERAGKNIKEKMDLLRDYFNRSYPTAHFKTVVLSQKNFIADFNNYEEQAGVELIIVPNKRRNVFARLLNPSIAHRLLFERDLPLLAIPV